jgi:hypothetical protein
MRRISMCLSLTVPLCLLAVVQAQTQTNVQHIQPEDRPIATGVRVGDTLYLSGQLASPVNAADPAKGTDAVYGDTEAQTMSTLTKIQATLKAEGLPPWRCGNDARLSCGRSGKRRQNGFPGIDGSLHALLWNQRAAQQARPQCDASRGFGSSLGLGGD